MGRERSKPIRLCRLTEDVATFVSVVDTDSALLAIVKCALPHGRGLITRSCRECGGYRPRL